MGAVSLNAAGPAPLRDCPGAVPGRSRGRLDEGGEAQCPYVGKRTGKGESATRSRTARTTEWGAPIRKVAQAPQRGRSSGGRGRGMRIGTREGTVVLKEGRKGAEGDPESGEARPSAERSEALLSGGRTVAPVKERGRPPLLLQARAGGMVVCEGSAAAPQAEQARGVPRVAPPTGVRSGEIGPPREPSQEQRGGGAVTGSPPGEEGERIQGMGESLPFLSGTSLVRMGTTPTPPRTHMRAASRSIVDRKSCVGPRTAH